MFCGSVWDCKGSSSAFLCSLSSSDSLIHTLTHTHFHTFTLLLEAVYQKAKQYESAYASIFTEVNTDIYSSSESSFFTTASVWIAAPQSSFVMKLYKKIPTIFLVLKQNRWKIKSFTPLSGSVVPFLFCFLHFPVVCARSVRSSVIFPVECFDSLCHC